MPSRIDVFESMAREVLSFLLRSRIVPTQRDEETGRCSPGQHRPSQNPSAPSAEPYSARKLLEFQYLNRPDELFLRCKNYFSGRESIFNVVKFTFPVGKVFLTTSKFLSRSEMHF